MSFDHLPEISGRLLVLPFEDRVEDGFGLIRTDTSPAIEVAIVHDGTDRGIGEAEQYAQLLGLSPVMLALLREACKRLVPTPNGYMLISMDDPLGRRGRL